MSGPSLRVLLVCVLAILLQLQGQQQCLSLHLIQADDDADDEDVEEYAADQHSEAWRRLTDRDRGLDSVQSDQDPPPPSWQQRLDDMERRVMETERKVKTLQKYASRYQQEDCAGCMCPVGSVKYGSDCLMYAHRACTWEEAFQFCANMMGKLVTIRNKRMQREIETFLQKQLGKDGVRHTQAYTGLIYTNATSGRPIYLGGSIGGSGSADGWYWGDLVNVTKLNKEDYSNWDTGQPPTSVSSSLPRVIKSFDKSCMMLEWNRGLKWRTTHCNQRNNFICHFAATPLSRGRTSRTNSLKKKNKKRRKHRKHRLTVKSNRQGKEQRRQQLWR